MSGVDKWERIWATHRRSYITDEAGKFDEDSCPFCRAQEISDEEGLIVARGDQAFVIMNKYPYSSGHLMVCTNRHISLYDELTATETAEISELTQKAMRVLRSTSNCQGFNIGMNQGNVAGAGIAGHLHQHIVPRWFGDSNFMPIVAGTKVMSELIKDTRSLLAQEWPN